MYACMYVSMYVGRYVCRYVYKDVFTFSTLPFAKKLPYIFILCIAKDRKCSQHFKDQ